MLADYLMVPFPRNKRPRIESSIMHGHMLYSPLMKNVTCLFRDGRDVMVSLYYHMLFESDKNSPLLVARTRADLGYSNPEDIKSNLSSFIEYIHTKEARSLSPYKFTWGEFVRSWIDRDVNKIKYEDMTENCYVSMEKLLECITGSRVDKDRLERVVNKYSFESQTKRKPGEEDLKSFIRKGKPGDWKEKFSRNSAQIFDKLYSREMVRLGYYENNSWIELLEK